ncbi:endonuclease III domain-containing protein [Herpetosiphon geysericola]|uniref:Endonuclease III n=1 Tax=Herpetosiphon geysericola TaxID=70996 RepID=A0A0P6Y081_9CHLR|nr:endonuclease III [Herpetosiphon geysericola]KPL90724.1 endonuclease III [Herpetosiphon geysericola]
MQDLRAKAELVYRELVALHGFQQLVPRREPMHELISTMLSHQTTEANEERGYQNLRATFPTWEAVIAAPVEAVAEAIKPANYAPAKAKNIQAALATILAERGEISIDFLAERSTEEGMAWLTLLRGVGPKTASLVLLFCFSKPILPVDTHVHRVSQRLGLVNAKTPTEAHEILWEMLPHDAEWLFNYHVALLRHGQRICLFKNPRCNQCPLTEHCLWYAAHRAE